MIKPNNKVKNLKESKGIFGVRKRSFSVFILLSTFYFLLSTSSAFGAALQNYNLGASGATNFEVGEAVWTGNVFQLQTRAGGTGVLRAVQMTVGTNAGIYINTSGNTSIATTTFPYSSSDNAGVTGNPSTNVVSVAGSVQLIGNSDAIVFGRGTSSFLKDEELAFGWGGGWYMTDGTYLRVRGNKTLYSTGGAEFGQPIVVGTPTGSTHAATKNYVDSVVGGGAGSGSFATLSVAGTSTLATVGGNVGIGTTGPVEKLHVAGGKLALDVGIIGNSYGWIYGTDQNHSIVLRGNRDGVAGNYTNYYQYGGTLASGFGHKFWTGGLLASQTLKMQIADDGIYMSGNVGIGVTNPQALLHVAGEMVINSGNWYAGRNAGGSNQPLIRSRGSGYSQASYPGVQVGQVGDHVAMFIDPVSVTGGSFNGNTNEIFLPNVVSFLQADSLGTNWLYTGTGTLVLNNGNVGISSASPAYKLDVAGTGQFSQPVIVGTPTATNHAATKSYVDSSVSQSDASILRYNLSRVFSSGVVGDWVEIGKINTNGRAYYGKITVEGHWNDHLAIEQYELDATHYDGGLSTSWVELPLKNGMGYYTQQQFAVDARNISGDGVYLRVRLKYGATYSGTVYVYVETNTSLTQSSGSGTGGSVLSGYLGNNLGWYFPVTTATNWGNSGSSGLFVNPSGNVGIGTASPTNKLQVESGNLYFSGSTNKYIGFNSASNWQYYLAISNDDFRIYDSESLDFFKAVYNGGTTNKYASLMNGLLVAKNNGTVGIGTTSPQGTLDVKAHTNSWSGGITATAQDGGSKWRIHPENSNGGLMFSSDDTTNPFRLYPSGTASYFSQPLIVGTPTAAGHAATKSYVDSATVGQTGWTDGGTSVYNTTLTDNVGIGTTGPDSSLHIVGPSQTTAFHTVHTWDGGADTQTMVKLETTRTANGGTSPQILFKDNYTGGYNWKIGGDDTGVDFSILKAPVGTFPNTYVMKFQGSTGNVGIGTTAPSDQLSISKTTGTSLSIATGLAAGTTGSPLNTDINFRGYQDYISARIRSWDESTSTAYGKLSFWTAANMQSGNGQLLERMRIDQNGNVGIGTTGPNYKLDVNGTSQFSQPVIVGTPTVTTHATTKSYVDSAIDTAVTSGGSGGVASIVTARTVGVNSGDTVAVGYFSNDGVGKNIKVRLQAHNSGVIDVYSYEINEVAYTGATTDWLEVPVSLASVSYGGVRKYALDIYRPNIVSTSDALYMRIRNRGTGGGGGGVTLYLQYDNNITLTQLSSTSTIATTFDSSLAPAGGAITGLYGNVEWQFPVSNGQGWNVQQGGLFITNAGNVGIGSTSPGARLDVNGSISGQMYYDRDNTNYYIDPAKNLMPYAMILNGAIGVKNTSPAYDIDVTGTLRATGNWSLGGAAQTNLNMNNLQISGVSKLDVGTIDPLYEIAGGKYATYASSIAGGVKEEYVGRARLTRSIKNKVVSSKYDEEDTQYLIPNTEYSYVIDFSEIEKGSDLWVWRKTVDFSRDNVEVMATAYGVPVPISYEIDGNKIIFRSEILNTRYKILDTGLKFSYRLVGKRFDWKNWPTFATDQTKRPNLIVK